MQNKYFSFSIISDVRTHVTPLPPPCPKLSGFGKPPPLPRGGQPDILDGWPILKFIFMMLLQSCNTACCMAQCICQWCNHGSDPVISPWGTPFTTHYHRPGAVGCPNRNSLAHHFYAHLLSTLSTPSLPTLSED